jgi:hypothetical protein
VERGVHSIRKTKAAEEVAQWGEEQQVHGDPEQAAILASFNAQRI